MSGKENWEFINKHVVYKCEKCKEEFYAIDIIMCRVVSCDGLAHDVTCKCGHKNEVLKMRKYGLSDYKLRKMNDALGDYNNSNIPWWTKRQPLWVIKDND